MRVLVYTPSAAIGQHLSLQINLQPISEPIDLFTTLTDLTQHLRLPVCGPALALLLPKNDKELFYLIQMRHLLRDIRVILVLPDRDPKIISNGHILRPRYVSYSDSDMSDIAAVVHKMMDAEKTYLKQAV